MGFALPSLERKWRKFWFWTRRERLTRELDEEIESHRRLSETALRDHGIPERDAFRKSRVAMGNVTLAKEESRDVWGFVSIEHLVQDVHYSVRVIRKAPVFSAIAIMSLALGIAGNTAIFSIINALLIRPLPYPEPERLVRITDFYPQGLLDLLREKCRSMQIASVSPGSEFNLTGAGPAVRITGSRTSANFFSVIGAAAERGRGFNADEDSPGRDNVIVLSHELWRTKLQSDPNIVGRTIRLDGIGRRVIGIMSPRFDFPSASIQFWIPARRDPSNTDEYWGGEFVPLIGRLRPGATFAQARAEIRSVAGGLWKVFPFPMPRGFNADATVISLEADLAGDMRSRLFVLLGAVAAVLLIACANVASLLLARATTRQKEIAMRAALGAGTFRIVRQLLTESLVLALVAGMAGVLLGSAGLALFKPVVPADLPGMARLGIDWRVAGFAVLISILTGLAFGIVPAWNARRLQLVDAMKTGSQRSATRDSITFRTWLIGGEIALTLVLVVGAGLLVKSLFALMTVNPGFNARRILTVKISPNESFCAQRAACIALYSRILERARGESGVVDAAAANTVPLDRQVPSIPVDVEDHPKTADFPAPMLWNGAITPGYLRLMQIPLLSGREFSAADAANATPVILVTASTARRFWPAENPIGKHIKLVSEKQWRTIIGVVADVRQFDLANRAPSSLSGAIYMPYAQAIQGDGRIPAVMYLIVKTAWGGDAGASIRRIATEADPEIPVGRVTALEQLIGSSVSGLRSTIFLFVSFAATAVLLAAIGIYGLLSYSVSQRAYEISVRMAIGATNSSIVRMILRQSMRPTLLGITAGVVASILLSRFLSGLLFGVTATDPATFVGVCFFLLAVAGGASLIPAWRASRIQPVRTLRAE